MSFRPACICRELDAVLWYVPNELDISVFTNPDRFVWLKTLKTSHRNWKVTRSVIFVLLRSAQSNSWKLASGKTFRPSVPGFPSNGCINGNPLELVQMVAALVEVLTPRVHLAGIRAAAGLPKAAGWKPLSGPTRSARSRLPPTNIISPTPRRAPEKMFALKPDWICQTPVKDQPSRALFTNPVVCFANGISQTWLNTKRWRRSNSELPRLDARLRGSCLVAESLTSTLRTSDALSMAWP